MEIYGPREVWEATRTHGETNDLADILVDSRVREEDSLARKLPERPYKRLRDQLSARSIHLPRY